jgi:hypothetical protein
MVIQNSWTQVWRKVCAIWILAMAMVILHPAESQAHWCPDPGTTCDRYFACVDSCEYEEESCWHSCNGYPEPYRTECQDDCREHYFDCWDFCQSNCFYFCNR